MWYISKVMNKYVKSCRRRVKKYLDDVFALKNWDNKHPFDLDMMPAGYFKSFGKRNPDKIFYVIWRDEMGAGFFSNFAHVLSHLKIADVSGMTPVVDFQNFKTLFNEE